VRHVDRLGALLRPEVEDRRCAVTRPGGRGCLCCGRGPGGASREAQGGGGPRGGGLPDSTAATCGRARPRALVSGCGSPASSSPNRSRSRRRADRATCCPSADSASACQRRSEGTGATAGNLVGSLLAYAVPPNLTLAAVARAEAGLRRCDALLARHGASAVFTARLMPLARTFVSLPAGHARIPITRFTVLTTLGCAIWTAGFVVGGMLLGAGWQHAGHALRIPLMLGPQPWPSASC
jgi:SNARE associated Golgi protein